MTALMNPYWTTVSVTALPPGWINVYSDSDGQFFTQPCPAMLIQERLLDDGTRDVRVVAGCFDGYELCAADVSNHYMTTTVEKWELSESTTGGAS